MLMIRVQMMLARGSLMGFIMVHRTREFELRPIGQASVPTPYCPGYNSCQCTHLP